MIIKRKIALKSIMTRKFREQLLSELERVIKDTKLRLTQIEFELKSHKKQPAYIKKLLEEKELRKNVIKELQDKISEIQKVKEGNEFFQGYLEGFVEIKEGDNLGVKLNGAEIILKDGIVLKIND